jgi:hypothetical protein
MLAGRSSIGGGLGFEWGVLPTIAMVGPVDDPRQALVRDAVAFWNQTLSELRSGSVYARLRGRKGAFRTI